MPPPAFLAVGLICLALHAPAQTAPQGVVLNRDQALALALEKHPSLAGHRQDVQAADAGVLLAAQPVESNVEISVEDALGTGNYSGFGLAQASVQYNRPLEPAAKRTARLQAADSVRGMLSWDQAEKRLAVAAETLERYADAQVAQQALTNAVEALHLAEAFEPAAKRRLEAGIGMPIELKRTQIAIVAARGEVRRREGEGMLARKRLTALWGEQNPVGSVAPGNFGADLDIPPLDAALVRLEQHPALRRLNDDLAHLESIIAREETLREADWTVGGGIRLLAEDGDATALLSLTVPMPRKNRNEGAVQAARSGRDKAHELHRATRERLRGELMVAHADLVNAHDWAKTTRTEVLPEMEEVFRLTEQAFSAGTVGLLDVLEARRALLAARHEYQDVLAHRLQAAAAVEGLIGVSHLATPILTESPQP